MSDPNWSIKVNCSRNGLSSFELQWIISAFSGNPKMLYSVSGRVGFEYAGIPLLGILDFLLSHMHFE